MMSEKTVFKNQLIIPNYLKMKQLRINTQILQVDIRSLEFYAKETEGHKGNMVIGGGSIPLGRIVNMSLNLPVL